MKIIGHTPRFYLRECTPDDASFWYKLNSDHEVIKWTGDKPFASVEEAKVFLENYDHYKKYDRGRWAIIDKKTEELLGWCGLKYGERGDSTDLGYRIPRKHWGKGIATETSHLSMLYGFQYLGLETIVGASNIENVASIKVLQKMGMSGDHTFQDCGGTAVEMEVDKYTYLIFQPKNSSEYILSDYL